MRERHLFAAMESTDSTVDHHHHHQVTQSTSSQTLQRLRGHDAVVAESCSPLDGDGSPSAEQPSVTARRTCCPPLTTNTDHCRCGRGYEQFLDAFRHNIL